MNYAQLLDLTDAYDADHEGSVDACNWSDRPVSGDTDDDIAEFFGGTVRIYHGGNGS